MHNRRFLRLAILAVSITALAVAGCSGEPSDDATSAPTSTSSEGTGSQTTASFTGVDGVESSIADTSRIVALNGDLTETIFALGAGDRVVGIDLTTTYPAEAAALPDIGLGRNLNAESVIGLSPTLVVGDTQVGPQASIDQIRAAGIPVIILQAESALEGVPRKIRTMGTILDLEAEAEQLVAEVQAEIDDALALAATATSSPTAAYLYVRGPETLLMFGNAMPTHFLIEAAGAQDAMAQVGVTFAEDLSAETLVEAAPEFIITPEAGFEIIGGMDAYLAIPGIADTPAGRSQAILTYDEALFLGMGPRVGQALRQLAIDLHPEIEG